MSLEDNIKEMERSREAGWRKHPGTIAAKLRWRASQVRHCFHVLPGETLLELGAGSGLWTEQLTRTLRGENPITAAVFDPECAKMALAKKLPGTQFRRVGKIGELPREGFDYVVGIGTLAHNQYPQTLEAVHQLLKPGGQFLFFEANGWNPLVFLKNSARALAGGARGRISLGSYKLMQIASQQGFSHIEIIPFDMLPSRTPRFLMSLMESLSFILEHAPVIGHLCASHYIWAKKPGDEEARRPRVNLAHHRGLFSSVSVVVPCHNEEMNISPMVAKLVEMYGDYIHEIVIVNDNSTDRTAEVAQEVSRWEPRVRLVNRKPPNGVGRALREGYAACTGRYILTMDSDFVHILPELRDLFEVIAAGHDGAIGSRFCHESLMLHYSFPKILSNRGFHALANLLLPIRARDTSNNLKLYRAEILKELEIEDPGFAANAETGLKPLVSGYDLKEVPISWINRTIAMGSSSFRIPRVAPHYASVLARLVWRSWRGSLGRPARQRVLSAAKTQRTL